MIVSGVDLDPRDGDEPSVELVWELDRVIWLTEFDRLFDELVFANGLDGFVKSNLLSIGVFREFLKWLSSSIIGKEYGVLFEEQDMKIKDINSKDSKFLICGL
ncbi:hypothetical protein [Campylobacter devanensis]|uniref:hypothetical protein n=1 Tax=Campylobacter devanensis TaxID=3161138 RepID=UPI0015D779D2|nr:hypothetical protein [Campylobacter sp. P0106]